MYAFLMSQNPPIFFYRPFNIFHIGNTELRNIYAMTFKNFKALPYALNRLCIIIWRKWNRYMIFGQMN